MRCERCKVKRSNLRNGFRSIRWSLGLPALLLMTAATESVASLGFAHPPAFSAPSPAMTDPYGRQYRFRPWSGNPEAVVIPGRNEGSSRWSQWGPMSQYRFRPTQQSRRMLAPSMSARRSAPPPAGFAGFPPQRFGYPPSLLPSYAGLPFMPPPMMWPGVGFPATLPALAHVPAWHRHGIAGPGFISPPHIPVPRYAVPLPYVSSAPALANAPVHPQPRWTYGDYRFRPQQLSASRNLFHYRGRTWRFRPLEQSVSGNPQPTVQGMPVSKTTQLPLKRERTIAMSPPESLSKAAVISEVPTCAHLASISTRTEIEIPMGSDTTNNYTGWGSDRSRTFSGGSHPITLVSGAGPPPGWKTVWHYAGWAPLGRYHPV